MLKLLNINSRFRNNYYKTNSCDFTLNLPFSLKNVINMSLESTEIPFNFYSFSSKLGTNEFTIEMYDEKYEIVNVPGQGKKVKWVGGDGTKPVKTNIKKYVIKIKDGNYTGLQLEQYLNEIVFSKNKDDFKSNIVRYRNIDGNNAGAKVLTQEMINKLNIATNNAANLANQFITQDAGAKTITAEDLKILREAIAKGEAGKLIPVDPAQEQQIREQVIAEEKKKQQQKQQQQQIIQETLQFTKDDDEGVAKGFTVSVDQQNVNIKNRLKGISCMYDEITNKFSFFRDLRTDDGLPNVKPNADGKGGVLTKFNIDWRIEKDTNRSIQLNMGWMLGFRQQYYNYDNDYVELNKIKVYNSYGFSGESNFNTLSTNYVFLSVNDYNSNFTPNLLSPFEVSTFNDNNILAKINTLDGKIIFNSGNYMNNSTRQYYGPVNINKFQIKFLDEFGRVIDLNNSDYSFTLSLEILYD